MPLQVFADTGYYETEPNDIPADFHEISGEITLYGTMVGTDQDGYLWTVSDNDARKRWTFRLNGEPGALTIAEVVRLNYADNGVDVESKRKLFTMGTRDGVTPSIHENLLFEPGKYVIGLAQAGAGRGEQSGGAFRPPMGSLSFGEADPPPENESAQSADEISGEPVPPNAEPGAYRMMITESDKLSSQPNPSGRDNRESAHALRLRGEFSTFESAESSWYSLTFNEQDAASRWDILIQAPIGRDLRARLVDAEGKELLQGKVDDKGKLRFPDLAPTADTTWYVELTARDPGFVHVISNQAVGQRIAGEEAEPNTTDDTANRVDFEIPVTGRIGGDDAADWFLFAADESTGDELRTLRIESSPTARVRLCLQSAEWKGANQCRDGETPVELPDLSLAPGEWRFSVARASVETEYTLYLDNQGPAKAGQEVEPNDHIEFAKGVPENLRIKGRFSGKETDFYQILVAGEPQLWRFQVIGDGLFELGYYDGSMHQKDHIRVAAGQRRMRLDNIFLLPGTHYVRVSGIDEGSYTLLARALGAPDPDGEIEPNDQHNKQPLVAGQTRTGVSSDPTDQDFYRFFVANWDHLKLTIQPPVDGILAPNVYWYGNIIGQGMPTTTPGEAMVMQGLFPPGDYHIVVEPRQISDAEYSVSLERLPRWSCPSDCEPNGHSLIWLSASLPPDLVLEGNTGEWRDMDYYLLPEFERPTELIIRTAEPTRLSIGPHATDRTYLDHDAEFGGYKTTIPAGDAQRLMIEARGTPYRLGLEFPNGELQPVTEAMAVDLSLAFETDEIAAYRINAQRVGGSVKVINNAAELLDMQLEAVTSDHRWRVSLDNPVLSLAPGASQDVAIEVIVGPDAWADHPVRVSVRVIDAAGRQAETWIEIDVGRETLPVNQVLVWDAPESIRGGLNVAWAPFGAKWTPDTPDWAKSKPNIRDGIVFGNSYVLSGGADWENGNQPELTLELPGDEPLPVKGTAITHFGSPTQFFNIREASLMLSLDGVHFEEALRFETLPIETIQYFSMAEAVSARFARLRIHSTFRDISSHRESMAEWKVILDPAFDLSGGEGFNIADPELGGHLVWDWPPKPYAPGGVLTPDDNAVAAHLQRGSLKTYVVGFNQNRAAKITTIDWTYADDTREGTRNFDRVHVSVSMDSNVGPWHPIGELKIDPQDASGVLLLPEPTWARFVRFNAYLAEGTNGSTAPGLIRIFEQPQDENYQSVLGEWDEYGTRGFYEFQRGLQPEVALVDTDHTTRLKAAPIQAGAAVRGQVSLGKQEHWYRMRVPEGENTLIVTMEGDPTVRTVVELENTVGDSIPLRRIDQDAIRQHQFEAVVEPGSEVWLHVFEPPRNVIFTWDTSASVNAYIPLINNSLVAFSSQVVPGQEAVNLMPFSMPLLMEEWHGEPYMLQSILNDYRRGTTSSSAEETLKNAARALAPRAGTKAIVVITDGETVHDGGMWGEFQRANPRVFSVQVAGGEMWNQNVMRDWADVNGGHYTHLRYDGEMEIAFDRASTLMRRPAGYTLMGESEFREAPGPGFLQVLAGKSEEATGGSAVELILDASGSMLQRLDGKRRIHIAKEVLTEAVREHIPAGTPVALRVFGHKEVDSCRTDLEIPLGPLNPDAAAAKIAGINAMNLARTPIADSLKAVEDDLKGASGVIVLVTDGEETCDGDPAAVIEALRAKGFAVNLNIVGFAIDDAELAAQFESWAEAGGGRYFGANDQSGLSTAIEYALQVSFSVFDQGGNEVATGQVGGEPIELEQGFYNILVRTQPPQRFEEVDVQGESSVTLELP